MPLPKRLEAWLLAGLLLATTLFAITTLADSDSRPSTDGMVLIPAGEFMMGNDGQYEDEMPVHRVQLDFFYIDAHEVTNADFAAFVEATGHVTRAEHDGHCWAYVEGESDWQYAADTDWRHPQGPGSTIEDKMNHPVVCLSWEDARAYAAWAGKRLPTEAEWEYAARGGSDQHFIARTGGTDRQTALHHGHHHGTETATLVDRSPSGKSHNHGAQPHPVQNLRQEHTVTANVWQGQWPAYNERDDGYFYTSPVGSFDANEMGVHDMIGNVWEWTADWYAADYYAESPVDNPRGPASGETRVARGGSWFCSPNYCGAYSTHYRGASPPDHPFNNVGFRCAMDVPASRR
ncbi:SUMF1/EgtB/PvdO family nonheme iron enzyme [candidate division GN15 bacterium]|nr:SUMF1/EgtB/PvdO family nonheme iron enzyme [candidate division GN15 bacterium]